MTSLVAMNAAEFAAYQDATIPAFAAEKVMAGLWSADEALAKAGQSFHELLPAGLATPGNFLFTIREPATNMAVGMLWFAVLQRADQPIAHVFDICIDDAHRRRGHANHAFAALTALAMEMGLAGIALNVFAHNRGAHALYRKLGFVPTHINMFKSISPP
jgi:ribosomal protein S18 acetylase RimI-like enzyme